MNGLNTHIYDEKNKDIKPNNDFDIETQNEFGNRLDLEKDIQKKEQLNQVQDLTNKLNKTENTNGESIKSYKEYEKIINCKNDLRNILAKKISKEQFVTESSMVIMSMLTDRESYNQMIKDNGGDLIKLKDKYKTQNDRYNKTLELAQRVVKENKMDRESNPAWFSISAIPELKKEGLNYKHYTTIPIQNYNYITSMPNLANQLRKLGLESDDAISLKVPSNFIGFLKHNDSIVVHFKKKENSSQITNIISERSNKNNIPLGDRELGRTTLAADQNYNNGNKSSFSELISKNIASRMYDMRQTGKYTEDVIIDQGILHSIQQSSKTPKVDGK